ncbi:hypothetical protein Peur_053599 [Populus x canadensis]
MATVSVLSNTGIEDSWNAKGNNGILLVCSNVVAPAFHSRIACVVGGSSVVLFSNIGQQLFLNVLFCLTTGGLVSQSLFLKSCMLYSPYNVRCSNADELKDLYVLFPCSMQKAMVFWLIGSQKGFPWDWRFEWPVSPQQDELHDGEVFTALFVSGDIGHMLYSEDLLN